MSKEEIESVTVEECVYLVYHLWQQLHINDMQYIVCAMRSLEQPAKTIAQVANKCC